MYKYYQVVFVNIAPLACFFNLGTTPGACRDFQEIKMQEQVNKLTIGTVPRSIAVVVEDDLVDVCKAGDDITL